MLISLFDRKAIRAMNAKHEEQFEKHRAYVKEQEIKKQIAGRHWKCGPWEWRT